MKRIAYLLNVSVLSLAASCEKPPHPVPYEFAKAVVIGKEVCKSDQLLDYWIVDVVREGDDGLVGHEVTIDGETFTNAFKTKGLSENTKERGKQVMLLYYPPTTEPVATDGCEIEDSQTYMLREIPLDGSTLTYF